MQRKELTKEQKRVINENPHLQTNKIAEFLGLSRNTIMSYRYRRGGVVWAYSGRGIPFVDFDRWATNEMWRVRYKGKKLFGGCMKSALNVQGQLIWMLENGLSPFETKRVRKPVKTINDPLYKIGFIK